MHRTAEDLRRRLKLKHYETKKSFEDKYPQAREFFAKRGIDPGKIREHSARIVGTGILAGTLLFNPPSGQKALPAPHEIVAEKDEKMLTGDDLRKLMVDTFDRTLPDKTRPLTREEEKFLENIILNLTGISARASLEGEHLNTTYGRIGLEQHLRRFPGDTIEEHGEGQILRQGLAPGKGAWGYFANSREQLTPELEEIERWYAVVQTLYLPDWNTRQPHLKNWYKYRKVMIVNTENGNAVVAAIADSGPAAWTGKHYGGSPEVMYYLGGEKYTKGPVILFFVDDPENKVPLGPVDYNEIEQPGVTLVQGDLQ